VADLGTLAALYFKQARYAEAEPLMKRSLTILEKGLGPEHPAVAPSLNNLAMLYRTESRYAEAEPLFKRSLEIGEKALGPDHPDVASSLHSLAVLYEKQGRYTEALGFSRRAVAILGKRFGDPAMAQLGSGDAEQRSKRVIFLRNVELTYAVDGATAAAGAFRVGQLASVSSAGAGGGWHGGALRCRHGCAR
jgi:tetratricopeptide (TPR) repeat protein